VTWSLVLAAGGITGLWLAGRGQVTGWLLGLAMQALWALYAVTTGQWGFLATAIGYGLTYYWNARRWWRARRAATTGTATPGTLTTPLR
jgi:hypothetical protein